MNNLASKLDSASYGDIYTWKEVEHPRVTGELVIWAAERAGSFGPRHRGYGKTEEAAVVDLLRDLEIARQNDDQAGPQLVMDDHLPSIADLLNFPVQAGAGGAGALQWFDNTSQPTRPEYKDLPAVFWSCLRAGEKIRAIRHLREATRLSLKPAKEIVDAILNTAYVGE